MQVMKNLKLPLVIAFLGLSIGPLLADSMGALSSPSTGLFTARPAPSVKVAACLPDGAACDKSGDCCSGNCAPLHHKCGR
jgi:hypothetical protein